MELFQFRRAHQESMDAYLTRFTVLLYRAANVLGVNFAPAQQAFMFMNGMGMGQRAQWDTLRTLNGRMPENEAQLEHIKVQLRRYGHLCESHVPQQPGRHYPCATENNYDPTAPGQWTPSIRP